MPSIQEGDLCFEFPEGWEVSKYDDWIYYRKHFIGQRDSIKGVDILAYNVELKALYLIEVKDYRHPESVKPTALPLAVTSKVIDTLAALLPASLRANDPQERAFSAMILRCKSLHVVLHVEQGPRPPMDKADLRQKLKAKLRPIDPHVKVVDSQSLKQLGWTVRTGPA